MEASAGHKKGKKSIFRRILKPVIFIGIGIFIAIPLFSMTYFTMVRTSTPGFCASCHEIQFAVNTWKTSTHANNAHGVVADCMDCHLPAPHDTVDFFYTKTMHGLNGDILVWNPVTRRRHELTSMGIRVTKETLVEQLKMANQMDSLELPYHKAIMNDEIPLSIGGGIGQSRTYMLLLKKAHLGEVSVTVWPKILKEMCAKRNIHVLE